MKNRNSLYLECYSGISGDMTVGTLLDLGADKDILLNSLASLDVQGYTIEITDVIKKGIRATQFKVILENEYEDKHQHRNLDDIIKIINSSIISEGAKDIARKIFYIVAEAESKVHGKSIENVHFHEVGAVDSIIDIVSTAVCLDDLDIKEVIISTLYEGKGHVKCQHGLMPVPVPAVVEIIAKFGFELKVTHNMGEMITPTGAAIAAGIRTRKHLPQKYGISKIGIGAGEKEFNQANVLRSFLINESEMNSSENQIIIMACNIDDMTGEELGFAMEKILSEGALDAYFTPIFMKKNRPAYTFTILCKQAQRDEMQYLLFKYTSTLGIRVEYCEREVMDRSIERLTSSLGKVNVKISKYKNIIRKSVEYEDVRRIAKTQDLSVHEVFQIINNELNN